MKKITLSILLFAILFTNACGSQHMTTSTTEQVISSTISTNDASLSDESEKAYHADTLPDYQSKAREVTVTDHSVSFVDGTGKKQDIVKNPKRVICLYPSHVVLWYELGGTLIGRVSTKTSESRMPEAAKDIPIVSTHVSADKISLEKIVEQNPDLVIVGIGRQMALVEQLSNFGIQTIVIDNENLDDYIKWSYVISNIVGQPERHQETLDNVLVPIQELLLKVPARQNPRFMMIQVHTKGNLVAYLSGTTAAGIASDLKGINIAESLSKNHKKNYKKGVDKTELSFESVLTQQPDMILLKHGNTTDDAIETVKNMYEKNPVWNEYTAVKENRLIDLPTTFFHYKPTKNYYEAYEYMARLLYPEIF